MLKEWLVNYKEISKQFLFVAKASSFMLSLSVLIGFPRIFSIILSNYHLASAEALSNALGYLFVEIGIFLFFSAKFFNLFFDSRRSFLVDQLLWIGGYSLLVVYLAMAIQEQFHRTEGITFYDMGRSLGFSSTVFNVFGFFYSLASPAKRITTVILSVLGIK